jgi:hypothetical protein
MGLKVKCPEADDDKVMNIMKSQREIGKYRIFQKTFRESRFCNADAHMPSFLVSKYYYNYNMLHSTEMLEALKSCISFCSQWLISTLDVISSPRKWSFPPIEAPCGTHSFSRRPSGNPC